MTPYFQYQLRVSHDANLVILAKICDELSCGQGKAYGRADREMDGRTGRRTDAGNDNTPSAFKIRKGPFLLSVVFVTYVTNERLCTVWVNIISYRRLCQPIRAWLV